MMHWIIIWGSFPDLSPLFDLQVVWRRKHSHEDDLGLAIPPKATLSVCVDWKCNSTLSSSLSKIMVERPIHYHYLYFTWRDASFDRIAAFWGKDDNSSRIFLFLALFSVLDSSFTFTVLSFPEIQFFWICDLFLAKKETWNLLRWHLSQLKCLWVVGTQCVHMNFLIAFFTIESLCMIEWVHWMRAMTWLNQFMYQTLKCLIVSD